MKRLLSALACSISLTEQLLPLEFEAEYLRHSSDFGKASFQIYAKASGYYTSRSYLKTMNATETAISDSYVRNWNPDSAHATVLVSLSLACSVNFLC